MVGSAALLLNAEDHQFALETVAAQAEAGCEHETVALNVGAGLQVTTALIDAEVATVADPIVP